MLLRGKARHQRASEPWAVVAQKLTGLLRVSVCPLTLCWVALSRSVVSNSLRPHDCCPPGSSVHGDSPGKNTGVGCHFLLQGIFPTQGSNLSLQASPDLAGRFFITVPHEKPPPTSSEF